MLDAPQWPHVAGLIRPSPLYLHLRHLEETLARATYIFVLSHF